MTDLVNYLINAPWYGNMTMTGMVVIYLVLAFAVAVACLEGSRQIYMYRSKNLFLCAALFLPTVLVIGAVVVLVQVKEELVSRYTQDKNLYVNSNGQVVRIEGVVKDLIDSKGQVVRYQEDRYYRTLGRLSCKGSLAECNDLLTNNQEKIVLELSEKNYVNN